MIRDYWQLSITVIDKLIITAAIAIIAHYLSRELERFRTAQGKQLEAFKSVQTEQLETLRRMQSEQLEQFKSNLLSNVEAARLTREALGKLAQKMAAAIHSMAWIAWTARYAASDLTGDTLAAYDKELHAQLPEIVGARIVLATLNHSVHDKIGKHVAALYKLDHLISVAKADYHIDPEACCERLAALHEQVLKFDGETIEVMASAILASTETSHKQASPSSTR